MALIECYECGREVSSLAPHCIHCGAPNSDKHDADLNEPEEKPQELAGKIEKKSSFNRSTEEPSAKQKNKATDSTPRKFL